MAEQADPEDPAGVLHRRTPFITIEIPLWPTPPVDARPWWWGLSNLTFRSPDGEVVWEGQAAGETGHATRSARVEKRDGFGWVVVVTLTHDKAKAVLDHLAMRHFIPPTAEEEQAQ